MPNRYDMEDMVSTRITTKGRTAIPSAPRRTWETQPEGSAVVRPLPDAKALFGIVSDGKRRDLREMEKAGRGIAQDAGGQGPAR